MERKCPAVGEETEEDHCGCPSAFYKAHPSLFLVQPVNPAHPQRSHILPLTDRYSY